jgi:hypothetical protein
MVSDYSKNFLCLPDLIQIAEWAIEKFQELHSAPNRACPVEFAKYRMLVCRLEYR